MPVVKAVLFSSMSANNVEQLDELPVGPSSSSEQPDNKKTDNAKAAAYYYMANLFSELESST